MRSRWIVAVLLIAMAGQLSLALRLPSLDGIVDSSNIHEEFARLSDAAAKLAPHAETKPAPQQPQTFEASIVADSEEQSRMSGPLEASIGDVADIPSMQAAAVPSVAPALPVAAPALPVEMDASIGDVADIPTIVSPTPQQLQSSDAPVELVASIGDVADLAAYAPPPHKPHPPKPHTRPIGPEVPPQPKPTPTPPHIRPVGPERPSPPHIHPVGPEVPHSGEGGSIEPVGPERPARPHIHPVGPEQPHETEPIIDETPDLAPSEFPSNPLSSLLSRLFGDLSMDLNDSPSMRFQFSPEDETETTTTQLPGGGVLVMRRFHHSEPREMDLSADSAATLDALGPRSMMFPPSPLDDFNAPPPPPPGFGPFGFFRRFFGPPPPPMFMRSQDEEQDSMAFPQLRQQEHIRMHGFPEDAEPMPMPMPISMQEPSFEPVPLDASIASDPAPEPEPAHQGCRHKQHRGGLRGFFGRVRSFFGGKHHDHKHENHDDDLSPEVEADPAVIEARAALRAFRSKARAARKQFKREFKGPRRERKRLMRQLRQAQKAEKRQLKLKLRDAIDAALAASSSAPSTTDAATDSGFVTPEMTDETWPADRPSEELHAAIVEAEDVDAPSNSNSASLAAVSGFAADAGIYDREAPEPTDEFMPPPPSDDQPRHHRGGWFRKHKAALVIAGALMLLTLAFLAAALVVRSRRAAAAAKVAQQPSVAMMPPHTPVAVAYAILPAGDDAVRLEMQQPQQAMVAAQ